MKNEWDWGHREGEEGDESERPVVAQGLEHCRRGSATALGDIIPLYSL